MTPSRGETVCRSATLAPKSTSTVAANQQADHPPGQPAHDRPAQDEDITGHVQGDLLVSSGPRAKLTLTEFLHVSLYVLDNQVVLRPMYLAGVNVNFHTLEECLEVLIFLA